VAAASPDEVRAAFDKPLIEAPVRLQDYFAEVIRELDGLDTALSYLSSGITAEALERMHIWHPEFEHLGFGGWAEAYFAEAQRKCKFVLPNTLTASERKYLDAWRSSVLSIVERSLAAIT
jgi:hypothetical protein